MRLHHTLLIPIVVALSLSSCGADEKAEDDSASAAEGTATPDPATDEPDATNTGTLLTTPVPCGKFKVTADLKPSGAAPPVMCAFESGDARVTITVSKVPNTFELLERMEGDAAQSKGIAPPALENQPIDGWTFTAAWPEAGGFNRLDRYLVDATGNVLACKIGVQGPLAVGTHASVCDSARSVLYTG